MSVINIEKVQRMPKNDTNEDRKKKKRIQSEDKFDKKDFQERMEL